jgi:hypothetical protein
MTQPRDKWKVGDRVELTASAAPFHGRQGVIRRLGRFPNRTVQVWCDDPDLFGRRLVRVTRMSLRRPPEP